MDKKRIMVSYHKMAPELISLVSAMYPNGFDKALRRVGIGGNFSPYFVLPVETDQVSYLIKVPLNTIDATEEEDDDNQTQLDELDAADESDY